LIICGRIRRPMGVVTLATRERKNQNGGVRSRSALLPGRVVRCPDAALRARSDA
jgi:hypothetical protein